MKARFIVTEDGKTGRLDILDTKTQAIVNTQRLSGVVGNGASKQNDHEVFEAVAGILNELCP